MLLLGPRTSIPDGPLPDARVSPAIGVGESLVVASTPGAKVASARVVGDGAAFAVGHLDVPEDGQIAAFGVSRGRPVALAAPVRPPQGEGSPEPVAVPTQPTAETNPSPGQEPSFAGTPGGGSRGWRGTAGTADPTVALASIQVREGDEYALAFSFFIEEMAYGEPGADNLIMQLKSRPSESHSLGLQLWDYAGDDGQSGGRGLWSSGEAMGGERFLAPVPEQAWHDVVVHFRASSVDAGFYELYLDGVLVDARDGVSVIVPGSDYAQIEVGLLRQGEPILGTSELRLDAVRVGDSLASVLP